MSSRYFDTLFTPSVKATQEREGSRRAYSRYDGLGDAPDELTSIEAAFIGQRDSFYIATTSESGDFRTQAAYAGYTWDEVFAQPRTFPNAVRVEITPLTAGSRYWPFVSITNNDTQMVTLVTPQ